MFAKNQSKLRVEIMILATLLMAGNLLAQHQRQQQPPKPPDANQISEMVEELAVEISLTEDQKADILQLFTDHFDEMNTAMSNQNGQPGDREEMDELRSEFEEQVKSLLTDEQIAGFEEFIESQGPQRQQRQQRPNR